MRNGNVIKYNLWKFKEKTIIESYNTYIFLEENNGGENNLHK